MTPARRAESERRERPILFSGEMVRALLAGRKTQTRRVVDAKTVDEGDLVNVGGRMFDLRMEHHRALVVGRCRYGVPGDRLWVRETWWAYDDKAIRDRELDGVLYRADLTAEQAREERSILRGVKTDARDRWRPSIHMPRWASRITLDVTEVRVQRLQEISDADACAEGTPCWVCGRTYDGLSENDCECFHSAKARGSFQVLWDSINGERPGCSWEANPWIWAVSFKIANPEPRS